MAQTDRQMRELSKERRLGVLEVAAEVIRERGLADTRISDIGERAGMRPGHVMYYFDCKDELLMEAVRLSDNRFYEEVQAQLDTQTSATPRITTVIEFGFPTGDTTETSTAR